MTNTRTDSVEAPQRAEVPTTKDAAPSAAQQESFSSLADFKDVKDSMTTNTATMHDVAILGMGDSPANPNAPKMESGERAPSEDQFKTPVVTSDDILRGQRNADGRPIREGEGAGSEPNGVSDHSSASAEASEELRETALDQLKTSASTEFDSDGQIKSVSTESGDSKISFEFGEDGEVTRRSQSPEGSEVAKFNKDGNQISREEKDASGEVVSQEIDKTDTVKVGKSADGKINSIDSESSSGKIQMKMDSDGNVRTRKLTEGNADQVTSFDDNGNPTENVTTTYGDNGNMKTRDTLTPDRDVYEKMDDEGRIVESKDVTDDETKTFKQLNDGSQMTSKETDDGTDIEIKDKDGNTVLTYEADSEGHQAITKMKNPDGSHTRTVDSPDSTSSITIRPDGSWESADTDKSKDYTIRKVGKSPSDPGEEQRDV
ncbi:MAG: hypothetical protein SGJ27_16035 [Candidatus Melainabacteria bacterium]|nr:hypothetical protein [Candidatus Melainabacteria bacterium]